ncbi:MAG TPA: 4-hydroxybenzoate octaprenyltransferase [Hyphomicrobiaceae bacterium]|nr:4-hydroxybenzoate octaprenyltransferase [Hyphomicrobiaceae bacterium]
MPNPAPPVSTKPPQPTEPPPVLDAAHGNWVDTYAPAAWRPYLRLARADRPIGTWLLLLPCWWSLALASLADARAYPNPWYLILFAIGAFVMRAAGCAYNDIVDRDFDARVARTKSRPIPSGQVSPRQALTFAVALALTGLAVLMSFNTFTIWLSIASLSLVLIYPFMKRLTNWPQFVLGLAFNWGALVGWSSETGALAPAALILYVGSVAWTIGYDTIYAHQDKEDDLMLGLKSTALHFGPATPRWVAGFYAIAILAWSLAAAMAGAHVITFLALTMVAIHFAWQVASLDITDADNCLIRFRSNRDAGLILFAGITADMALTWGLAGAG